MSRYNLMNESSVKDEEDGEFYPDVLSVNYNKFEQVYPSLIKSISSNEIDRFWILINNLYGVSDYEDIMLILNGIPYRGLLSPGDILYFSDPQDLLELFSKPDKIRTD